MYCTPNPYKRLNCNTLNSGQDALAEWYGIPVTTIFMVDELTPWILKKRQAYDSSGFPYVRETRTHKLTVNDQTGMFTLNVDADVMKDCYFQINSKVKKKWVSKRVPISVLLEVRRFTNDEGKMVYYLKVLQVQVLPEGMGKIKVRCLRTPEQEEAHQQYLERWKQVLEKYRRGLDVDKIPGVWIEKEEYQKF